MSRPHLVAIGGAHVDRRGRIFGDYRPGASNPGRMSEEVGGGAFNAVRTAVRLGVSASILSLRGGDQAGDTVARAISAAGIADLSSTFLDRATPSYTALLDRDGELIAALADMGLYDFGFAKQLARRSFRDAAASADALLVDANLPEAALLRIVRIAAGTPLFAIGVSPAKVVRLASILPTLSGLFVNRNEAAALTGLDAGNPVQDLCGALRRCGLARGVITAGSSPAFAFEAESLLSVSPPESRGVADVTGAGDAFAGAAVAALMNATPFPEAVRHGVAAASLAVETHAAAPVFDDAAFFAALARVPPLTMIGESATSPR